MHEIRIFWIHASYGGDSCMQPVVNTSPHFAQSPAEQLYWNADSLDPEVNAGIPSTKSFLRCLGIPGERERDSGMKPNSFRPIPEPRSASRD
jgi:hypothetical protein